MCRRGGGRQGVRQVWARHIGVWWDKLRRGGRRVALQVGVAGVSVFQRVKARRVSVFQCGLR